MNTIEKLKYDIDICNIHAERLKIAIERIGPLFPFTPEKLAILKPEELSFLDLMSNRFAKLQDTIGQKIFPLFLEMLGELQQSDSFIDRLNKLEKLEVLESTDFWKRMRDVRNEIAHEYPDDPEKAVSKITDCFQASGVLLSFWEGLKKTMNKRVPKSEE